MEHLIIRIVVSHCLAWAYKAMWKEASKKDVVE